MTMRPGQSHVWNYNGKWKEKKVAPGRWVFEYTAGKGQKARPGVPSGSRYHWFISAHQYAYKTRAGHYRTKMVGVKRLVEAKVKRRRRRVEGGKKMVWKERKSRGSFKKKRGFRKRRRGRRY